VAGDGTTCPLCPGRGGAAGGVLRSFAAANASIEVSSPAGACWAARVWKRSRIGALSCETRALQHSIARRAVLRREDEGIDRPAVALRQDEVRLPGGSYGVAVRSSDAFGPGHGARAVAVALVARPVQAGELGGFAAVRARRVVEWVADA
jgi:hypothetical protein